MNPRSPANQQGALCRRAASLRLSEIVLRRRAKGPDSMFGAAVQPDFEEVVVGIRLAPGDGEFPAHLMENITNAG